MGNTTRGAAGILAMMKARFESPELAQQLVLDVRAAEVREFIAALDVGIHA